MKIKMISTQKGSVDGVTVKGYVAGTDHDLTATKGERELAAAFVGARMAVEVIEDAQLEVDPDSEVPGTLESTAPAAPKRPASRRKAAP